MDFLYKVEERKPIKYPKIENWDVDIVETAGFVPLAVRFKQMEQAGYRARFSESEFSSKDVSDMYLNHPEFDIGPEDDLEEAQEKYYLRQAYIKEVAEKVRKRNAATDLDMSESETKANKKESAAKEKTDTATSENEE